MTWEAGEDYPVDAILDKRPASGYRTGCVRLRVDGGRQRDAGQRHVPRSWRGKLVLGQGCVKTVWSFKC